MTVRFSGETPWETIVNHCGLDIEDESQFHRFVHEQGYNEPRNLPLETLEELYREYQES